MKPTAPRLAAWIAVTLVVGATVCPRVAPALDASLAGLTELCAPAPAREATASPAPGRPDRIPLRVPRCGVA